MSVRPNQNKAALTALLIAPDRKLAGEFIAALRTSEEAFQIILELKSYPTRQTLETGLRRRRPDAVIVDTGSNPDNAAEVIRWVGNHPHPVHAIGLSPTNDAALILNALRQGATEFLHPPFDAATLWEVAARLRRLRQPEVPAGTQSGIIAVFSGTKPGSGASILAAQTAFALRRITEQRILLADFDLLSGAIGFYLKLTHRASILDALANAEELTAALWSTLVVTSNGMDVLLSPEVPYLGPIDSSRLKAVLDYIRLTYDWAVIDLPVVFENVSLLCLSHADRAFLVSTPELPSLHLTRKAILWLKHLGFPTDPFQLLLNRFPKRTELGGPAIEKLVNCAVFAKIPNDFLPLNRAITLGQPVDGACDLGKTVEALASALYGKPEDSRLKPAAAASRPPLAQLSM